jgi:hypothetical protein
MTERIGYPGPDDEFAHMQHAAEVAYDTVGSLADELVREVEAVHLLSGNASRMAVNEMLASIESDKRFAHDPTGFGGMVEDDLAKECLIATQAETYLCAVTPKKDRVGLVKEESGSGVEEPDWAYRVALDALRGLTVADTSRFSNPVSLVKQPRNK